MLDGIFSRYGWDVHTWNRQPRWFRERIVPVLNARNAALERKRANAEVAARARVAIAD